VDPYAWPWNPEALVVVPGLAGMYALAVRKHGAPALRQLSFAAGVVLLLAVTITPIHTLGVERLLLVHLLQNVVLAEWAPLLLVLGLTPAMAARVADVPGVRGLTHPAVALPLWVGNYIAWHLPPLYDAALRSPHTLLHLEHACYLVTGLLLWWPVVHDSPRRLGSATRAAYVFAAFVLASPIGLVLALVPEPIYAFYESAPRTWGLSAITDQQLAGATMALEQAFVFFAVFAVFFVRFLAEQDAEAPSPAG
jgi:cytochrome c oxidase assembly factor CtaG